MTDLLDPIQEAIALNDLRRVVLITKEAMAHQKTLKDVEAEYRERRKDLEGMEQRGREAITTIMKATGSLSEKLDVATISMKALPPRLVIDDEEALPDWAVITEVVKKPDRLAIAGAMAGGRTIPGCHMSNGGETIQIRMKG